MDDENKPDPELRFTLREPKAAAEPIRIYTRDDGTGNLYALSIVAENRSRNLIQHNVAVVYVPTDEDARAAGLKQALKEWPEAEGWRGHHAAIQRLIIQVETAPTPAPASVEGVEDDGDEIVM